MVSFNPSRKAMVEYQGWLHRRTESRAVLGARWARNWFVLRRSSLYWYSSQTAVKAEGCIDLTGVGVQPARQAASDPARGRRRKHVLKFSHPNIGTFFVAAENFAEMSGWMSKLSAAALQMVPFNPSSKECCSEGSYQESEESVFSFPVYKEQLTTDSLNGELPPPRFTSSPFYNHMLTPPRSIRTSIVSSGRSSTGSSGRSSTGSSGRSSTWSSCGSSSETSEAGSSRRSGSWLDLPTPGAAREGQEPPLFLLSGDSDSLMGDDRRRRREAPDQLKQPGSFLVGRGKPSNQKHCRTSFMRRWNNEGVNEKPLLVRILNSTLKAKDADLLAIEQVLVDPAFTAHKCRNLKRCNFILLQDITQRVRPAGGTRALPSRTPGELRMAETPV